MTVLPPESPQEILAHLPLNPKVFMVLLALAEGLAHGYEIKRKAESQSGGSVSLDAGSLYRTIAKLEKKGFIVESEERPEPEDDDARRRYYLLTGLGAEVLAAEAGRLRRMVDAVPSADPLSRATGSA